MTQFLEHCYLASKKLVRGLNLCTKGTLILKLAVFQFYARVEIKIIIVKNP